MTTTPPPRRPLTPLEVAILRAVVELGDEPDSSEFYHCDTCGLTAHWMDLRPHSVTAKAEQDELDRRINGAMDRMYADSLENVRYRRGECPAEDPLPHNRCGVRLAEVVR